jgi:transposase
MEISGLELQSCAMDHHGLVAGICKEIGLLDKINKRLFNEETNQGRVVKPGAAVVAMILNGLGFTNRRLYLTHQFFEGKPIDRLLGEGIKASDLTDYTLGHTLDEVAAYGASKLFGELAFEIALEQDLLGGRNHLDTTSMSLHGEYEVEDAASTIEITHGYSKDHRPDLKQVVLSLVVNGPADLPLWMEPLSGNSSDKASFHETIRQVEAFRNQIDCEAPFKWVADSALYSKDHLLKSNDYIWLTRVPETLSEAKALISMPEEELAWTSHSKGYSTASTLSEYGGIKQRCLLVFSKQAYEREKKTLLKKLKSQDKALAKALWHLGNEIFNCEEDARKSLKTITKKYPLHVIESEILAQHRHAKAGKPKPGVAPLLVGHHIKAAFKLNEHEVERRLCAKGRFILATNDLDAVNYTDQQILEEYKSQQKVERGFHFLKDPWFMVDSVFLKLPHRVEALMMVMTLCLLVYNLGQYRLRETLALQEETLPNQLGKEVKNPTLRWVFQLMENIAIVSFYDDFGQITKQCMTNLTPLRQKIIRLMGKPACQIYGILIQENSSEGLGM